jgi:hypothetical protein
MMDPNASCVSCCVVEAMARRTGREGGTWATAVSMVGGSGYQIVMVLDRPAVGTCLRRAKRINSYFLLAFIHQVLGIYIAGLLHDSN